VAYCIRYNPEPEKQNFFIAGMADKKIVCVSTAIQARMLKADVDNVFSVSPSGTQDQVKSCKSMTDIWEQ
jgi:hypothetical protein